MKTKRHILLVLIYFVITTSFILPRPLVCPITTYDNWDENTPERTIKKTLKRAERSRAPKNFYKIAEIQFSKTYLFYLKTGKIDTIAFLNTTEFYKKSYSKAKNMTIKKNALNKIALCYYYIGDFKNAENWFYKTSKIPDMKCATLNYAKCLMKTNSLDSSETVINNYCLENKLNPDSIKIIIQTDIKNGH